MKKWIQAGLLLFGLIIISSNTLALDTTGTGITPPITNNNNSPATIGSVMANMEGVVNAITSVVTGLAASASNLMYITTPSSITAMHANSASSSANQAMQTTLSTILLDPIRYELTKSDGFEDTNAINVTQNSGYLLYDIYNALNSQIAYKNKSGTPVSVNLSRSGIFGLETFQKSPAYQQALDEFNSYIQKTQTCAATPSSNACANPDGDKADRDQTILNTIFQSASNDPFVQSYTNNDFYYNPEFLFSVTSYGLASPSSPSNDKDLLDLNKYTPAATYLNQLDRFAELPSFRPPSLPEPMTETQFNNLDTQREHERGAPGPSTLQKISTQQQLYIQLVTQMVAGKSLAMDNLYLIHAKRIPTTSIYNKKIIDTTTGQRVTSPLQLDSYAASRRLTPAYYAEMAGANPATIQRETLFLLAEMNQRLFQNQLMGERALATLSLLALSSINNKSAEVAKIAQTIQSQIDLLLSGSMGAVSNVQNGQIAGATNGGI